MDEGQCRNISISARREWLLTNGIGGYAMGTVSGLNTRRYHGHLVAAIHPPTERMVLLAAVDALVSNGNNPLGISANQYPGSIHPEGFHTIKSFSVDEVATWRYRVSGMEIEKRLALHPGVNAATIAYENVGKSPFTLILRPLVCHRDHHGNFHESAGYPNNLRWLEGETHIEFGGIPLVLGHPRAHREAVHGWYYRFEHSREIERGLPPRDDLFCPCELRYELQAGEVAFLTAATQSVEPLVVDRTSDEPQHRLSVMLKDAASRFIVETPERTSILAGYPWFTDWGRDTMISLPGLCLHTGRTELAKQILRDYAGQMRRGLIPNRFVESGEAPDYNTVDATLWFVNAVYRTLDAEWDLDFAESLAPSLLQVFECHMKGTVFGIGVDPEDGLLKQGEPGVQLTWMDAKVGDWVVTPRHGKPVEISALWINALRAIEWIFTRLERPTKRFARAALKAEECFETKFWQPGLKHYLDTADPADATLRPNQVIAMALPFSPVDPDHARQALETVTRDLLTPNGLRTLGPEESGYRGRFEGSMSERDAAYHQGTVWPWLLGPYVTALVRYTGDRQEGKRILREARRMLTDYGIGGIAEVYDGDEPQTPGGCPWQAWSIAEILRSWVEDCKGD